MYMKEQDTPPSWWYELPVEDETHCPACSDYEIALDDVRGCFERMLSMLYDSGPIDKESLRDELGDMALILSVHLPKQEIPISRDTPPTEDDLINFNEAMRSLLT